MNTFQISQPKDVSQAVAAGGRYLAGGTTLIDLMKLNVETPSQLVDINRLPLNSVEETPEGGLKIGAVVRNATLARHPIVVAKYAVLSEALLSGASAQLRNMATTGGIFCRGRAVSISATLRWTAISACRGRDARPSAATIACWRFWAPATIASPPIHPI